MKKATVIEVICSLFIILFVYAAINKLMYFHKFRVQVGQSPMLTSFADWIVWIVPGIELIISIMLAFPRSRLLGLYASFSLMTMFTVYIILILYFSEHIPCSCGGVLQNLSWKAHLIFNSGFVFLGFCGVLLSANDNVAGVSFIPENRLHGTSS